MPFDTSAADTSAEAEAYAELERRAFGPSNGLLNGLLAELDVYDTPTLVAIADYRDRTAPRGWMSRMIRDYLEDWR